MNDSPSPRLSDELQKLAALHAQGVLSAEEFQVAKKRVIAQVPAPLPPNVKANKVKLNIGALVSFAAVILLGLVILAAVTINKPAPSQESNGSSTSSEENTPAEDHQAPNQVFEQGAAASGAESSAEASNDDRDYLDETAVFDSSKPFQLGNYSYQIGRVITTKVVGSELYHERASEGAVFVVVYFSIRNDGYKTAETYANDFMLRETAQRRGEKKTGVYSADTKATNVVSHDFILRELHPGVTKKAAVAFEVPEDSVPPFELVVPEKGLWVEYRRAAVVWITPEKPETAAAQRRGR
ncbi:MAG TPA: DUF4352 domain-containing protein [Candidatus Udaeobacter sp.]|jgi:hypothetical protein